MYCLLYIRFFRGFQEHSLNKMRQKAQLQTLRVIFRNVPGVLQTVRTAGASGMNIPGVVRYAVRRTASQWDDVTV